MGRGHETPSRDDAAIPVSVWFVGRRFLEGVKHDLRAGCADARLCSEPREELRQRLHRIGLNFEKKPVRAGRYVKLKDIGTRLGKHGQGVDFIVRCLASCGRLHVNKCQDLLAKRLGVHGGDVPLDDPTPLQNTNASMRRRLADTHMLGQLGSWDLPVLLEEFKQFGIDRIKGHLLMQNISNGDCFGKTQATVFFTDTAMDMGVVGRPGGPDCMSYGAGQVIVTLIWYRFSWVSCAWSLTAASVFFGA